MPDKENHQILFRKEALKKLTTPEELDKLLFVVKPKGWIALIVALFVLLIGILWSIFGEITSTVVGDGIFLNYSQILPLSTPNRGMLREFSVTIGQKIKKDQKIADIYSEEKKEIETIYSPINGTVVDIRLANETRVEQGAILAYIEREEKLTPENDRFYCFIQASEGADRIKEGMPVYLFPWGEDWDVYGSILGNIEQVAYFPASQAYFSSIFLNDGFSEYLTPNAAVTPWIPFIVKPKKNPVKQDEFIWSTGISQSKKIPLGNFVSFVVVLERRRPITYLFPSLYLKEFKKTEMKGGVK